MEDKAEELYQKKKYSRAIPYYKTVKDTFEQEFSNFNIYFNEKINYKQYESYYFALYNIACCYSLTHKISPAREYLTAAIKAGYPYIDHLLDDTDLNNLLYYDSLQKDYFIDLFNRGTKHPFSEDQYLELLCGPSTIEQLFLKDNGKAILYRYDESNNQHFRYGSFTVRNFCIECSLTKEEYLDSKGFIVGPGIKAEDCEKISKDIDQKMFIPLWIIDNRTICKDCEFASIILKETAQNRFLNYIPE